MPQLLSFFNKYVVVSLALIMLGAAYVVIQPWLVPPKGQRPILTVASVFVSEDRNLAGSGEGSFEINLENRGSAAAKDVMWKLFAFDEAGRMKLLYEISNIESIDPKEIKSQNLKVPIALFKYTMKVCIYNKNPNWSVGATYSAFITFSSDYDGDGDILIRRANIVRRTDGKAFTALSSECPFNEKYQE